MNHHPSDRQPMHVTPKIEVTKPDAFRTPAPSQAGPASATKAPSPADDLADAAEEIATKFSESVERRSKSLEERSVRPRTLLRVEKLQALYTLLNGGDDRLDREVRRLLAMGQQQVSLGQLLELADGDPAKAEVLAQHALQRARGQGSDGVTSHLQQAMQELHDEHGAEVQAGINTAEALALFSRDPQQLQHMRRLYYRSIVGQASLATLFDGLLSQFDEQRFGQGIHTLMRAISDDLSSAFPSLPAGQLRALLRDLTASQQLINILNGSRELLERLAARRLAPRMSAPRLTRRLLDFTQATIYPREIKTLGEDAVGDDALDQSWFLNAIYPLMQQLPLPIWKDGKSRQSTLNLLLRVMTEFAQYERQQMTTPAGTATERTS
jgi:type III secretion protein W